MKRLGTTRVFLGLVALLVGGMATSSVDTAAQIIMGESRVEKISGEWTFNPFFRPRENTNFYGSGDGNNDGSVNEDDYNMIADEEQRNAISKGSETFRRLDMNLDEVLGEEDLDLIRKRIETPYDFERGIDSWNELPNSEARLDYLKKALEITGVDTIPLREKGWNCTHASEIFERQFNDINEGEPMGGYTPYVLFPSINIPTFTVNYNWPSWVYDILKAGHAASAVITGDSVFVMDENNQPKEVQIPHPYGLPTKLTGYQLHPNFLKLVEPQTDWIIDKNRNLTYYKDDEGNQVGVKYLTPGTKLDFYNSQDRGFEAYVNDNQDIIMYAVSYDPLEEVFSPFIRPDTTITSIQQINARPDEIVLRQNTPNPFNATTQITYRIDHAGDYSVYIYNIFGQLVTALVEKEYTTRGTYSRTWNGTDDRGRELSSGVYFYALERHGAEGTVERYVRKMTLVR